MLPCLREVHADARRGPAQQELPPALRSPAQNKSPARWAYERMIHYIQRFEEQLDADHEVAMAMTGGHSGVLRVQGMGYFDPDMVTFYGIDPSGAKTQLIQHVTQLSVLLRAVPRHGDAEKPYRIGFRLARELDAETGAPDADQGPDGSAAPAAGAGPDATAAKA